jgi:FkbM family methyltransferase
LGFHDLALTEVLLRLIGAGEVTVDIGANIGYVTSLMASRVGSNGKVFALEPNPTVLPILERNLIRIREGRMVGPVELYKVAASDYAGFARFVCPFGFRSNQGIGRIEGNVPSGEAGAGRYEGVFDVTTNRLDYLLQGKSVAVMKIDVEGHEASVIRGAAGLIGTGKVKTIVFEDHGGGSSEACRLLAGAGMTLFQLGWSIRGPRIEKTTSPRIWRTYEAPNYIATQDAEMLQSIIAPRGWVTFRRDVAASRESLPGFRQI